MSDILSQYERLLYLKTTLGPDKLILKSFEGKEALNELFHFHLELVSEDPSINIKDLIGKPVTVGIRLADGSSFRYFHGICSAARKITSAGRLLLYAAEMVPYLWRLTKAQDCRIYQNATVPDVVLDVLSRHSVQDKRISATGSHPAWTYCTQYRESDFDFISRLMETEGLFYFFEHTDSVTRFVAGDSFQEHPTTPGQTRYKLEQSFGPGYNRPEDVVFKWQLQRSFRSGKYTHRDFNYEDPQTDLTHEEPAREVIGGNGNLEIYDYPGEYEDRADASSLGKLYMEEEEVEQETIQGLSNARCFSSGYKFKLYNHEDSTQNRDYLITSVSHYASEASLLPEAAPAEATYSNSFTCIPLTVPFRPGRKTPKHIMRGVQTAIVVGPSGEEIYTDEMGRIKIQFHWDRIGRKNENSSCWVRVMQPWAGMDRGANFLPRIGDEVVVDFLEGDPDRPLVIGSVYNPVSYNPWKMPDRKNWTGIKSKSTQGGGADDANELRFDDTAGSEVLLMHAQKDMEVSVENDSYDHVMNDAHRTVDNQSFLHVVADVHEKFDANVKTKVATNKDLSVGGDMNESVTGNFSQSVTGNFDQSVTGNQSVSVTGNLSVSVTGKAAISATGGLSLICGGSHVYINPSGVVVQGPMLYLNCGMPSGGPPTPANAKSPASPTEATKPVKYKDK